MPLPIAHGLLGASVVAVLHPKIKSVFSIPLLIGAFLANTADLDFVFVLLTGDKIWHRGFSHSILFSVFVFIAVAIFLGRNRIRESLAFSLAYFSHVVLDFLTTRLGGGLELLWFFSPKRFISGWVGLSETPSKLSPLEILRAIGLEILIFGFLFAIVFYLRNSFSKGKKTND